MHGEIAQAKVPDGSERHGRVLTMRASSSAVGAVIEVCFQVGTPDEHEYVTAGWAFLHLFDPGRNGLSFASAWNDTSETAEYDFHSVPIYAGSPRILAFIKNPQQMAALTTIPGASISYRFFPRPDIRPFCFLWPENVFVAHIPGKTKKKRPQLLPAVVSKISVKLPHPRRVFEDSLITSLSAHNAPLTSIPQILERRLHIGFHNTHTFINQTILTLEPDEAGLTFNGRLDLKAIGGAALCIGVEYRCQIVRRGQPQKEGWVQRLRSRSRSRGREERDEGEIVDVWIGWVAWIPDAPDGTEQYLTMFNELGPNPFGKPMYRPLMDEHDDSEDDEDMEVGNKPTVLFTLNGIEKVQESTQSTKVQSAIATQSVQPISPVAQQASTKRLVDAVTSPLESDNEAPHDNAPYYHVQSDQLAHNHSLLDPATAPSSKQLHITSYYSPTAPDRPRSALSRIEKARLYDAGYMPVLDEDGHKVPAPPMRGVWKADLELESRDLRGNDVTIGFLGATFDGADRPPPKAIFFTYQFYNFPVLTTDLVAVHTGPLPNQSSHQHPSASEEVRKRRGSIDKDSVMDVDDSGNGAEKTETLLWPAIFYRLGQDRRPRLDKPPGLTLSHFTDPVLDQPLAIGVYRENQSAFAYYMAEKELTIDVWDGDSLLHIGTANVKLKDVLRQGLKAVAMDVDVDVVDYQMNNITLDVPELAAPVEPPVPGLVVGQLHLRLSNISRTIHKNQPGLALRVNNIRNPYRAEKVLFPARWMQKGYTEETVFNPFKLPDVDSELQALLKAAHEERLSLQQAREGRDGELKHLHDTQRKLERVKEARQTAGLSSGASNIDSHSYEQFAYQMDRRDRQRDLQTISVFRERRRPATIRKALTNSLTTTHTVHASFGQCFFFEHLFRNPYAVPSTFLIHWSDDELRLVTSPKEWTYLRRVYDIPAHVESKFVELLGKGEAKIYLDANETVAVPFVFQTFLSGVRGGGEPRMWLQDGGNNARGRVGWETDEEGVVGRTITVSFMNPRKIAVSLLDVVVVPTPYYVDRSLRLFAPENEQLRHSVRFFLPNAGKLRESEHAGKKLTTQYETENPGKKYVRCNTPEVICSVGDVTVGICESTCDIFTLSYVSKQNSNVKELVFKYRCNPAPETRAIYFLVYDDPYHTSLLEIWRCTIHSLNRLDINCVLGQTNAASLILKGSTFSRSVQCYVNRPNELLIMRNASFTLTANALNEIPLFLRPRGGTNKSIVLNVVDVDQRYPVSSWYIVPHCTLPTVTKAFEITVPRGKSLNKRISYTNPYPSRKLFRLATNCTDLIEFKSSALNLEGGSTDYIHIRFLPHTREDIADILIFLNDEQDRTEECLCIRVRYTC
ncbi:hypothetical protein BC832DRAFT_99374 [Gaertneriomyces semiglobifer]|nr:hypothetical protein BC832DRAFT_99374 [Gaertneriomyces semiglobifer]